MFNYLSQDFSGDIMGDTLACATIAEVCIRPRLIRIGLLVVKLASLGCSGYSILKRSIQMTKPGSGLNLINPGGCA